MKRHRGAGLIVMGALSLSALAVPAISTAAGQQRGQKTHTVSFYAKVIHSSPSGLLVRTAKGKKVYFTAKELSRKSRPARKHHTGHKSHRVHKTHKRHARHSGRHHSLRRGRFHSAFDSTPSGPASVAINIVGLQPGVTVLITETVDSSGVVSITITLPPSSSMSEQSATGVITGVGSDAFMLHTPGDSDLRLSMAPDTLAGLNLQSCDTADVTYHQDANLLIADTVTVTGTSSSGDCQNTSDATGTITSVSGSGLTISSANGPLTFSVADSDITQGFGTGDVVDVTYTTASDGTLDASDVEYVESQTSGVVSAVTDNSLTITDSGSGQSDTFVSAPQGEDDQVGSFNGIQVGDQVDVTYHTAGGPDGGRRRGRQLRQLGRWRRR